MSILSDKELNSISADLVQATSLLQSDSSKLPEVTEAIERVHTQLKQDSRAVKKLIVSESLDQFLSSKITDEEVIVKDLIEMKDKLLVVGPPKSRKTFFVLQLGLSIAFGRKFLKFNITQPRKVLIVQMEVKRGHFKRRLETVCMGMQFKMDTGKMFEENMGENFHIFNARGQQATFSDIASLAKSQNAEVIIIDPIYKLMDGDENKSDVYRAFIAQLDSLIEETGAAVIYVHHDPKGHGGDRQNVDRGAGSNLLSRDYDACICLTNHNNDEEDLLVLSFVLRNYAPIKDFSIEFDGSKFCLSDAPPKKQTATNRKKAPNIDELKRDYIPRIISKLKDSCDEWDIFELESYCCKDLGLSDRQAKRVRKMIESDCKDEVDVETREKGKKVFSAAIEANIF